MKVFVLLVALPIAADAGGSFLVDSELRPILDQVPVIKKYLFTSLDIDESGSAGRIGQIVNPRFGGRRVGPYRIKAKPKGDEGGFTLELVVNTTPILTNENDEPTNLAGATKIREEFLSLEVKPLSEPCSSSDKPESDSRK